MTSFTPLDLTLAVLYALRRFGLGRTLLLTMVATPVYLWSLPPTSCSCFGPMFRRCDRSLMYVAAMKSDLKYLMSQQEIYFADVAAYSDDPNELAFVHSDGVEVVITAEGDSWSATATHAIFDGARSCSVYAGVRPEDDPLLADAGPFQVACTPR